MAGNLIKDTGKESKYSLKLIQELLCSPAVIFTAMASHLGSGRINLADLRESYRSELLECLDRCTGSKVMLWF